MNAATGALLIQFPILPAAPVTRPVFVLGSIIVLLLAYVAWRLLREVGADASGPKDDLVIRVRVEGVEEALAKLRDLRREADAVDAGSRKIAASNADLRKVT